MLSSSHQLGARSCGRNQCGPVCKPWQRSIKKFLAGSKSTSSVQRQATPCIAEGAKLHARPDSTGTLILYSHMLCPFAERALLTLLFKGVPHQAVHVDRCEKPLWFVDLCKNESLHDEVLIIELHGRIRASGTDTCRYSNLQDKQQVDTLIQACQGFTKAGLNLLAGNDSGCWQIGTGQTQAQWKAFEGELEAFQAAIRTSGGPFLLGSEVSLADLIHMPFMERFAVAMPAFTPYDPCAACDGTMGDWLYEMQQLKCCQIAAPDHDLYLQAIRQQRRLDFFEHNTFEAF